MNKTRRNIISMGAVAAASMALAPQMAMTAETASPMDVFKALETRRSVRAYTKDPISDKDLQTILKEAMMAPSAANEQPWDFVVIRKPEILAKIGEINQYAAYAHKAPAAILVCLNENREKIKGMGILDVGMCAENLMLAAHGLGIGSVFTGIYPMADRMKKFQELVGLPANVLPIGLIVLGYPEIKGERTVPDRFREDAIHYDTWNGK